MSFRKLILSGIIAAGVVMGGWSTAFAQDITYKVQQGDTFWIIGSKFGVSTLNLLKANNANENTILYVGQNIIIPTDGGSQTIHTVQSGETYWTISKKYGIDFYKLLSANNANESSMLNIGDKVTVPSASAPTTYTVQSGDTYWIISKNFGIDFYKLLAANNANESSQLSVGQKITIPSGSSANPSTPAVQTKNYTVSKGETYWTISKALKIDFYELLKLNGANESTYLDIGQTIKVPASAEIPTQPSTPSSDTKPYVTYTNYSIKNGDDVWTLAVKFGIPYAELLSANSLTESSVLNAGMTIRIPVHHVPVTSTPGAKYGENLDWWTQAQYVLPRESTFEVEDFYTGKTFNVKRTGGSNHSDTEALTLKDANIIKEIWGGSFSWTRRPVIVKINGRRIAASMASMPHAGNDSVAGGVYTTWRSDNYGAGINYDYIKNNGMDGHFDIHFLNSTRHKDGELDLQHQSNIKISAGIK